MRFDALCRKVSLAILGLAAAGCGSGFSLAQAHPHVLSARTVTASGTVEFGILTERCSSPRHVTVEINGVPGTLRSSTADSDCESQFTASGPLPKAGDVTLVLRDGRSAFRAVFHHLVIQDGLELEGPRVMQPGARVTFHNRDPERPLKPDPGTRGLRFTTQVASAGSEGRRVTVWNVSPRLENDRLVATVPAGVSTRAQEGVLELQVMREPPKVLACEGFSSCALEPSPDGQMASARYEP